MTLTHAQRWKVVHDAIGHGHLYQGRFKSFIIEQDEHLARVLRYVHRNPLRAERVSRTQEWRWGSCYVRLHGPDELRHLLAEWPIDMPSDWVRWVNTPQTNAELEAIGTKHPARATVWRRRLDSPDRGPSGAAEDTSPPRTAAGMAETQGPEMTGFSG